MKYHEETHERTVIDQNGNETSEKVTKIKEIGRSEEPDYIKIYTRMWCEYNGVPTRWRELFLWLACNMTYANKTSRHGGQTITINKFVRDDIMADLGWKSANLTKGLQVLVACNAIRRIGRGVYQINPSYAGKGEWKYNPKLDSGGIENIRAFFDFKSGTVDTEITYSEDSDPQD